MYRLELMLPPAKKYQTLEVSPGTDVLLVPSEGAWLFQHLGLTSGLRGRQYISFV